MRESAAPQCNAEQGLGGHGAVSGIPARMRAQEHGEEPRGVTPVEDRTERLEDLPPDLREL